MITARWKWDIAALAREFAVARVEDEGHLLAALVTAVRSAPSSVGSAIRPRDTGDALDRMLFAAHHRELAFALTERAGLMISRSAEGHVEADVVAAGLFPPTHFRGPSVALAIGGALATGLAEYAEAATPQAANQSTH